MGLNLNNNIDNLNLEKNDRYLQGNDPEKNENKNLENENKENKNENILNNLKGYSIDNITDDLCDKIISEIIQSEIVEKKKIM